VSSNKAPEDAELADALERLGSPPALTLASIIAVSENVAPEFSAWLSDRRNSRKVPHRLEECGYVAARNHAAKDGLYKVNGRRCAIYARIDLNIRDRIAAADRLASQRDR
jgi:hypothetical protein